VLGTITAWVLVRDDLPGKSFLNAVIDLPFALPTIVAGLTLLSLYGPKSPVGLHIAYTRASVVLAMLFVTLPFVVRSVQPVLLELDTEMEQAARSLGAGDFTVFRKIVLPNLLPGILSGSVLVLARALGEIGSVVLLTGNLPYRTEVASVLMYNQIQDGYASTASAIAVVLLVAAFVLLLGFGAVRFFATRHERA
jgi:sulfate transport system permease protein